MKSFEEILAENSSATLFVVTIGSAQFQENEIAKVNQMLPKFAVEASEKETTVLINIDSNINDSDPSRPRYAPREETKQSLKIYNLSVDYGEPHLRYPDHPSSDSLVIRGDDVVSLCQSIEGNRRLVIVDHTSPYSHPGYNLYDQIENKDNVLLVTAYYADDPAMIRNIKDSGWSVADNCMLFDENITQPDVDALEKAQLLELATVLPDRQYYCSLWSQPKDVQNCIMNDRISKVGREKITVFRSMNALTYDWVKRLLPNQNELESHYKNTYGAGFYSSVSADKNKPSSNNRCCVS